MLTFGPISSLFDFLTFGLMLGVLHAGPTEFRTGWFLESLATQTLIIFAIRTRRIPFFRSRPSAALVASTLTVIAVGVVLTLSPLAGRLGFTGLPWQFFVALAVLTVAYLVLVEITRRSSTPIRCTSPGRPSEPAAARTGSSDGHPDGVQSTESGAALELTSRARSSGDGFV